MGRDNFGLSVGRAEGVKREGILQKLTDKVVANFLHLLFFFYNSEKHNLLNLLGLAEPVLHWFRFDGSRLHEDFRLETLYHYSDVTIPVLRNR